MHKQNAAKIESKNGTSDEQPSKNKRKRRRRKKKPAAVRAQAPSPSPQKRTDAPYNGVTYQKDPADFGVGDFDVAQAPEGFRELGFGPELLRGIHGLGFGAPTPIQRETIPIAREGRDIIGCAQTGTGKTASFALPTLEHLKGGSGTRCLVLTPTRELAIQVSEQFQRLGKHLETSCAVIYGGVDYEPQFLAFQEKADVIVATPGRLLDHLNRKSVHFRKLEILIIDEADRMLDMGFAEEITDILKRLPKKRQTMLFSATMPEKIQDLANRAVSDPVQINISPPSTPAEGIHHGVYPISMSNKPRGVLGIIDKYNPTSVLIFTRTKAGADVLCNFLENEKISVAKIHSDRSQRQRERALAGFRQGKHRILVATDIVSRGIDVTGISHVINYDVPEYPEDYVHRAGRTARAGRIGYAMTLMSPGEITPVKNIERFIGKALPRVGIGGFADDVHQQNLENEPKPLLDQPSVARYERLRKMPRRTGLALR
ncbi:MAG: DEAD/DEAH box helicase [Nitrospinae bacterium]|nr:DEAD/DEAH box helicase [Nitrospinota bacterium]